MKKIYILSCLAIAVIVTLQLAFVNVLYNNYTISQKNRIDRAIYEAIGLEFYTRTVRGQDVKYMTARAPISKMSQKTLDSLLAICPIPTKSTISPETEIVKYDVIDLMNRGIIKSHLEIENHIIQDDLYEDNNPINSVALDSILNIRIGENYKKQIVIKNGTDSLISATGSSEKYNYESKRIQIGFKNYQFITISAQIPVASFVKESIWILILSVIIILIPITVLICQLTIIRTKISLLKKHELNINGIIHDLKSPLSGVYMMLSLFKMTEQNSKRKELIVDNMSGVKNIIGKIERLLGVSRMDRSKIVVCKDQATKDQLTEKILLVQQSILYNCSSSKKCSINITNNIPTTANLFVDLAHFDTVLNTLFDNAAKYSGSNVGVDVTLDVASQNHLLICVSDNGFGIAKKDQKLIFKPFYRAYNKNIAGYGIGLAYLKEIASAHGGAITVESEIGKGSKFKVTFNCNENE